MRSKGVEVALRSGCLGVKMGIGWHWQHWLPCPPPGNLPNPGTEPVSFMPPASAGRFFASWATGKPLKSILKTPAAPGSLLEMFYLRPCAIQDNGPSEMSSYNPQNLWRSCFTWQRRFCWLTQGDDPGLAGWAQYNHIITQIPSVFKKCFVLFCFFQARKGNLLEGNRKVIGP